MSNTKDKKRKFSQNFGFILLREKRGLEKELRNLWLRNREMRRRHMDEIEIELNFYRLYQTRLEAIKMAIAKWKKGKYGYCLICKKKIPEKRLKIVPEASRCIKCLTSVEIK